MSEKRKDSKGRVLKDGESQRANGTYDYRYTDIHKKRRCIYAKSLTELRKKEDELRRDMADGIDYAAGEMTVAELVDRYMNLKRGLKQNSLRSYGSAVKRIHADPFGQKPIKTVKLSDAKVVPVYDYCMPEKECSCGSTDDPCSLFRNINFPVGEFFPPNTVALPEDYEEAKNFCACCHK